MINSIAVISKQRFSVFIFLCIQTALLGQSILGVRGHNYYGAEFGIQMSGIRKEDFVFNNITPKLNIYLGKRLNDIVSIQFGYEGFYFNTIANEDRRYFNYYNLRIENILCKVKAKNEKNRAGYFSIQLGGGLFQNKYDPKLNFCADVGLIGSFKFENNINGIIRLNSMMGWDLYQGDADIINSLTIGFTQNIK